MLHDPTEVAESEVRREATEVIGQEIAAKQHRNSAGSDTCAGDSAHTVRM